MENPFLKKIKKNSDKVRPTLSPNFPTIMALGPTRYSFLGGISYFSNKKETHGESGKISYHSL
jgi:hypothetical protein